MFCVEFVVTSDLTKGDNAESISFSAAAGCCAKIRLEHFFLVLRASVRLSPLINREEIDVDQWLFEPIW